MKNILYTRCSTDDQRERERERERERGIKVSRVIVANPSIREPFDPVRPAEIRANFRQFSPVAKRKPGKKPASSLGWDRERPAAADRLISDRREQRYLVTSEFSAAFGGCLPSAFASERIAPGGKGTGSEGFSFSQGTTGYALRKDAKNIGQVSDKRLAYSALFENAAVLIKVGPGEQLASFPSRELSWNQNLRS